MVEDTDVCIGFQDLPDEPSFGNEDHETSEKREGDNSIVERRGIFHLCCVFFGFLKKKRKKKDEEGCLFKKLPGTSQSRLKI